MTETGWTVRPMRVGDAAAVVRIHVAGWQHAYAGVFPADYLEGLAANETARARRLRAELGEQSDPAGPDTALVAVDGSDTIGAFVRFGPYRHEAGDPPAPGDGWGEVYAIYADPTRIGTGAGHALMAAALHALSPAPVALWVLAAHDRARAFYRRHGFEPDGATGPFDRGGVRATGHRMVHRR